MSDTVIRVENLSKQYRLGVIGGGTLHEDLSRWWARVRHRPDPKLKIGQEHLADRMGETFWALKDVSFEVKQGEALGIIGRNGAGKSTLLKVLSQVTAPTDGCIKVKGRIASLLEVGTGFHPELTGRENIYLNGAILGMTNREIDRKFDEIVAFSEVEQFIDTPVKRYSSGMYVRLAFAVAAHLEPEILIVDEVLAVGDAAFQKKCLGKMGDVAHEGRTVLFVSHNMAAVQGLCRTALHLEKGRAVHAGSAADIISGYLWHARAIDTASTDRDLQDAVRKGTGKGQFLNVTLRAFGEHGQQSAIVHTGCDIEIAAVVKAFGGISNANAAVEVYDCRNYRLIDAGTAIHGKHIFMAPDDTCVVTIRLKDLRLRPGRYLVALWFARGGFEEYDYVPEAISFDVVQRQSEMKYPVSFPGPYQCEFDVFVEKVAPEPVITERRSNR